MQKKFLSNIIILLVVNILVKPFWILGIDRGVQNSVGNEAYGQYIVLFNMSLLFTMLLDFGINNYTSSFIARHKQMLGKKFAALFPLKLIFSGVYLVVTLGFAVFYGINGMQLLLLMVLAFNQVLALFILFIRANISGLQLFRTDAFLSVTDRGMMIVYALLLMLTLGGQFSIGYFVLAQTLGYATSLIIAFSVLKKSLPDITFRFDKLMMLSMIRKSWPYALLALLMTIYMRADYLLIKKIHPDGDEQNGIYAVANRLLEAANMMAVLVSTMLLPLFSNMIKKREQLQPVIRTGMILLVIPSVCVAGMAWFYNEEIMLLLSKNNPLGSAGVFRFVMISFVAMCTMYIFGTLLTANGNLLTLNVLAAVALVINIVLNLVLIPGLGAKGAAIAAVCTHSFIAVSNLYFAGRYLTVSLGWSFWSRFILTAGVMIGTVGMACAAGLGLITAMVVLGLSLAIMLFITRLLHAGHVRQLLSSRI